MHQSFMSDMPGERGCLFVLFCAAVGFLSIVAGVIYGIVYLFRHLQWV